MSKIFKHIQEPKMQGCLVQSLQELKELLRQLRQDGKKVVFTNGCFDILHAGHVHYLAEARSYGDVLIVGINSDSSVRRLKPGRPINPQDARAKVLCALKSVDYVIIFEEDTPYELIKVVKPDVLVKGGDWKKEDIVGADIAKETFSLDFLPGYSTTAIVNKILTLKHSA